MLLFLFIIIGSAFIDPETCPCVCYQIVCGPYPNWTYGLAFPVSLSRVIARVPVCCSYLFASIYWFAWSKTFIQFLVQAFFCWLLSCVYRIYWIIVHFYWNLSLSLLANCQWAVSKLDVQIFFHRRFVEGRGKVTGIYDFTFRHQYINWV